jgi:hypothetical protein
MKITNEFGFINFKSYMKTLNDLPSDRNVIGKFTGNITLKDSFEDRANNPDEIKVFIPEHIDDYLKGIYRGYIERN